MSTAISEVTRILTNAINMPSMQFTDYTRVWPFSSESIKNYINDIEGKTILSVSSSGDHALESYFKGAKHVDVFDLNNLALHYTELKFEALKNLPYEDFFTIFAMKNKDYLLDHNDAYDTFKMLKEYLSEETYELFKYIYTHFVFNNNLLGIYLFYISHSYNHYINHISYFNEYNYNLLQNILRDKIIKPRQANIHELPYILDKKYDYMYLSNISTYQKDKKQLIDTLKKLKTFLNENGLIYYNYIYGDEDYIFDHSLDILGDMEISFVPSVRDNGLSDIVFSLKK